MKRLNPTVMYTAVVVVALDAFSKTWARHALASGPRHIAGPLSFDLTFNSGISFSMSRHGASWVTLGTLLVAAAVAIVGLRAPDGLVAAGYGLLLGGGLGNVIDRMASTPHLVTDFIKVSNFPIFNMSDICVSAGFLVLAIAAFRGERLIA